MFVIRKQNCKDFVKWIASDVEGDIRILANGVHRIEKRIFDKHSVNGCKHL